MTMQTYSLLYGRGTKEFQLDSDRVLQTIEMPQVKPLENIEEAVLEALAHPIGCGPLAERIHPGDTVTFICNDTTRVAGTHLFLPILVRELNKLGVKDSDMEILIATGAHRPMTKEEMETELGEGIAQRIPVYNNDCNKEDDFDYFGTTSYGTPVWINKRLSHRDHVILTGTVVFHYHAGFGGGRKAVLPGCARMDTIRESHTWMMDPRAALGKTETNPSFKNLLEGVGLWAKGKSTFMFNPILDEHHRMVKIFAGDYVKAHEEACKYVAKLYGVPIHEKADIVIASCGGYPKDINVYQMQKTMDTALLALKKGGVAIILAECEEGVGNEELLKICERIPSIQGIEDDLRAHFKIGAHKAYLITRDMKDAKYILVTGLKRELVQKLFFQDAFDNVPDALSLAEKLTKPDASVILMPYGSLTVPIYGNMV